MSKIALCDNKSVSLVRCFLFHFVNQLHCNSVIVWGIWFGTGVKNIYIDISCFLSSQERVYSAVIGSVHNATSCVPSSEYFWNSSLNLYPALHVSREVLHILWIWRKKSTVWNTTQIQKYFKHKKINCL